jgi:hypothetical protein
MTKHSITSTITKYVGPDAEETQVSVCVTASITPPDRSVGIDGYGWEDLEVTDPDGGEITISEADEERLGNELIESYIAEPERNYRGAPHEYYD